MQKRVFIIHGWGESPEEGWFPWLKKELEERDIEVQVPEMPDTDNPKIEEWVSHLNKIVGNPDENTYFVGHSIGCQAILRYLEGLKNKKIRKAIFVAGWFYLENLEEEEKPIAKPWLETPIDFDKVKATTNEFVVFLSDNDPYEAVQQNKKAFEERIGAEVIVKHDMGHFSGSDGMTEFPEVRKAVLD